VSLQRAPRRCNLTAIACARVLWVVLAFHNPRGPASPCSLPVLAAAGLTPAKKHWTLTRRLGSEPWPHLVCVALAASNGAVAADTGVLPALAGRKERSGCCKLEPPLSSRGCSTAGSSIVEVDVLQERDALERELVVTASVVGSAHPSRAHQCRLGNTPECRHDDSDTCAQSGHLS